jgi:glycosyltransferase involved in cell wall biosynthesis
VTTNAETATVINSGSEPPMAVPVGVDCQATDAVEPTERRALHLREDAIIVACPYAPNGRVRLLNAMRTLALLAPRHPRLRAVVYGHRAADDDIRMQAAALGVAPIMQFIGVPIDPIALMKAADFAWITADHDAAALGCLDAMCASRAIVAERSRTIDYLVGDGINGTVLPEGDAAALASAAASVIARSEARLGYGAAGRTRVQREFGLTAMINGFERAAEGAHQVAVPT